MRHLRSAPASLTLIALAGATALGSLVGQGARPIDGVLGIDTNGKITGVLHSESEAITGTRISLAVAIGTFSSEAAEDAAIENGQNGSKNFKVVSSPRNVATIDLGAPWLPGVSLPLCENATLIVRAENLSTGSVATSRNRLYRGQFLTIISKEVPRPIEGMITINPPVRASSGPKRTRQPGLPIQGNAGMDEAGRLIGDISVKGSAKGVFVAFSPGRGQSLRGALDRIVAQTPGYIPFTAVNPKLELGSLPRTLTTPELPTQTAGGLVVVKHVGSGKNTESYTFLEVLANGKLKPIPAASPITNP